MCLIKMRTSALRSPRFNQRFSLRSNSKIYEKELLCNETFRYSLQILPVPWPFVN